MIEFGLGTIGIGKPWGFANPEVPDESLALALLEKAFALGVRYFDTAPSYGVSEQRLAIFLGALTPAERAQVRIATKFGEHWDAVCNCTRPRPECCARATWRARGNTPLRSASRKSALA